MTSYSKFAEFYDTLTADINYKEHALYYQELINKFGSSGMILLDLACGTGSLSEEMARLGFDVIGVDSSQEMLSIALDKKYDSELPIQYLCQDMKKLDMFGTIDITICALDSINHLSDLKEVKRAFERVSLFSNTGALFIFDMNTPYKHKNILGNNIFIYDTKKVYCVWENAYSEIDDSVEIDLTFFEKVEKSYNRYEESFTENAYPIQDILRLLEQTGFEIAANYDYLTLNDQNDNSEKITFVARKVR